MEYLNKWIGAYVRVDSEYGQTYYGIIVAVDHWNLVLDNNGDEICILDGIAAVTKFSNAVRQAEGVLVDAAAATKGWTAVETTNPLITAGAVQ